MTHTKTASVDLHWQNNDRACHAKFDLSAGVTALVGPSGAGKTTLARILCGLNSDAKGSIHLKGRTLLDSDSGTRLKPEARNIGMVMQDPALFPTMSVRANIMMGANVREEKLKELLDIAALDTLLDRMPATLSGGEARRAAIVRAMAAEPKLLILDEPMNGLDPKRRRAVMALIRRLAHAADTAVLLITHQLEEMLFAADQALLMEDGHIVQQGSVETVLSAADTGRLLAIDDAGTLLTATVKARAEQLLTTDIGGDHLYIADDAEPIGARLRLRILARDIALSLKPIDQISVLNQLRADIISIEKGERDDLITVKLAKSKNSLRCKITKKSTAALKLKVGTKVVCLIKAVAVKELLSDI